MLFTAWCGDSELLVYQGKKNKKKEKKLKPLVGLYYLDKKKDWFKK